MPTDKRAIEREEDIPEHAREKVEGTPAATKWSMDEEFIRPTKPSMSDVKKLPRYDQERPVLNPVDGEEPTETHPPK